MGRRHHCAFGEIPADKLEEFKELVKWGEKPYRIAQKLKLSTAKVYWMMSALEEQEAAQRAREKERDSVFPTIEAWYGKRLTIKGDIYILDNTPIRALDLLKKYNEESGRPTLGKIPVS